MKPLLLITAFFSIISWQEASCQEQGNLLGTRQSNALSLNESARWTFSPMIFPYIPVFNQLRDKNDSKIDITSDKGIIYGLRAEKYFPNSKKGFGVQVDYLNREIVVTDVNRFYISENSISLTPFYAIKKGTVEQLKHLYLELGIKNQFTFYNSVYYSNTTNSYDEYNYSLLKKFRMYGYIGVGLKRDEFNKESSRIGLSTLGLGIFLPMFNQANLARNNKFGYPSTFEIFRKSAYTNAYFVLNYFQNIDIKKSSSGSIYQINGDFGFVKKGYKVQQYLPPLINWTNPITPTFGNFYMHSVYQTKSDTVLLSSSIYTDSTTTVKPSLSVRAGYTIHFLGFNNNNYYMQDDKGMRFDLFTSAGFQNQVYNLKGIQEARANVISFELSGGVRFGVTPKIYFIGGYTRRFEIKHKLLVNLSESSNFKLANINNDSFFGGISIKNALNIRMIRTPSFESLKKNESNQGKWSISLGFGI